MQRCSIERILLLAIALVSCHNWYLAHKYALPSDIGVGGVGVKKIGANGSKRSKGIKGSRGSSHPWLDSFYSSTLESARALKRIRRGKQNSDGANGVVRINQPNGGENEEENVGDDALGISYLQDLFHLFIQSSVEETNSEESNEGEFHDEKEPYILSPICGGCQHAFRDPLDPKTNFACNDVMKRRKNQLKLSDKWREKLKKEWEGRWKDVLSVSLEDNADTYDALGESRKGQHEVVFDMLNSTMIQASIEKEALMGATLEGFKIVAEEIESCKICDIDSCWKPYVNGLNHGGNANTGVTGKTSRKHEGHQQSQREKYQFKYWRYDQTAPKIFNAKTLLLPSIPTSQRIPPERFGDIKEYLKEVFAHVLPSSKKSDDSGNSENGDNGDSVNKVDTANEEDAVDTADSSESNANAAEAHDEEVKSNSDTEKNEKHSVDPFSTPFLVEYNPSLAPIPENYKSNLPPNATYLLSVRVTPANNCFPQQIYEGEEMKEVKEAVYQSPVNHLGLALLDKNLNLIPIGGDGANNSDGPPRYYNVVIDLDKQLGFIRSKQLKNGLTGEPVFMDYRLFTLNDEIYLHANSDLVVLAPLDLSVLGFGVKHQQINNNEEDEDAAKKDGNDVRNKEDEIKLTNLYGGNAFQVTLRHSMNTIWSGGDKGKNYALFTESSTVVDRTNNTRKSPAPIFAELEIHPHHKLQQILPQNHTMLRPKEIHNRNHQFPILDSIIKRKVVEQGELIDTISMTNVSVGLLPSFFTVDELWFPGKFAFKEFAHGGACCVLFSGEDFFPPEQKQKPEEHYPWGDQPSSLLVGIAHTHVQWKPWYNSKSVPQSEKDLLPHTHYVSFAYAFEPQLPFRIIARSGYFCLGFSLESDGGIFNPHSTLTMNRKLMQYNETFECPQIHFVSTFVEKAGDSSKTVIGYGLNDCTPRLVEVEKREIGRLLFPDPWEMVLQKN